MTSKQKSRVFLRSYKHCKFDQFVHVSIGVRRMRVWNNHVIRKRRNVGWDYITSSSRSFPWSPISEFSSSSRPWTFTLNSQFFGKFAFQSLKIGGKAQFQSLILDHKSIIHNVIFCSEIQFSKTPNIAATLVHSLTGGNWQKWKRVFLTCFCHEIYRDEAVGLKSCKYTWKITIFVKMWNLGQYRENLIFCQLLLN